MNHKKLLTISALISFTLIISFTAYGQSRAKAAYLAGDINGLVEIASQGVGEESKLATEYIAMTDFRDVDFKTLSNLTSKAKVSQNKDLAKLFDD